MFLIPVYILINLAIRPSDDLTPALIPSSHPRWTTSSTRGRAPACRARSSRASSSPCCRRSSVAHHRDDGGVSAGSLDSRLSSATFYVFLIGLLLPFQLALLPLYAQMRDLHLLGTIWSLVIFYSGMQLPFTIFLITTFLRTAVPIEYEEAGRIDGCSNVRVFWHIVVPLLRPVLGTAVILIGVGIWNDFFTPLLYLAGGDQKTIPVALYQFVGQYATNWPLIFASLIISMIPILAIYLLFQRYVIQGFAGGLKG